MAKCTVTLNIARLGRAYVARSMIVADVESRDDGTFWTTTEHQPIPLTNAPLASVELDQGMPYSFTLPDGRSDIRLVPIAATADFSDMVILARVSASPLVLVLEPDVAISNDGFEPVDLSVGDYWIVTNPALSSDGDLYVKTE